ncbi:MAG: M60 family metallopeptidase, partial [Clostridium sp.]|nr:M60 family metallopeptidase [Clostridium sp.]
NYGQPGAYISKVTTISPGVTEIEIPTIISADVEKGGQVMARVTQGSASANVKIRLSGVHEIPHLNVNNIINDKTKEDEVKEKIRKYISELRTHVNNLPSMYPTSVSAQDKIDNIYKYDRLTSIMNTTDIEGDRFTLMLPATEIYSGIVRGMENNTEAQVERVYNALLAWEQEIQVSFAKKGVFEEVRDFNKNGQIDSEDNAYFNKHKAPLTRVNIKYQRMMMGAAAYASTHHIGVGFGSSSYIQGVPYKFDEEGNVTNKGQANLYGVLIGHEVGHAMDIPQRVYAETSNNLLASITTTMLNEDNGLTSGAMNELYDKVTSNTRGLSTNRSVVLGMLWQPYLAYEDDDTYKMLLSDFDNNISDDSYFAKLNRAYREMTDEEKANGDRDQYLIRMNSKVAGKDLSSFYMAHGIMPNEQTLKYVSQFEEETRPIQYINDEARRLRMAGKADMEQGTVLSASYAADSNGNKIAEGSYVNSKEVKINLSVDKSNEKILGYEIYRNGRPCGFITRNKNSNETVFTDALESMNNRVVNYKAVAYDYNLNATNEVELGNIKVRHDGGIAKNRIHITSNTISVHEESNDIHGSCANHDLKLALDNNADTHYEGRMLESSEYNSSIHESSMNPKNNPYIVLDTTEIKTLVGIKYTAPLEKRGLIFKKSSVSASALKKYKIEVSKDGSEWTTVKSDTLKLDAENPTQTIYFNAEGVTGGKQLNSYNARYVKITSLDSKKISAAELELITPPGDNIEIGVADDNINYENGIGLLKEDYVYQLDNPDTDENEYKFIPKGSVIITGEYRGNPAFNVPLVLNQDEEHIADIYTGLLFAEIPDNGNLEDISEGNWVYFVEPQYVDAFMKDNKKIFAELYRTDSADASEGGQRLVSDTFEIEVPEVLPEISLSKTSAYRASNNLRTMKIDKNLVENISNNR